MQKLEENMILIDSRDGLIGDFLGQIPTMQKLSEESDNIIHVRIKEEISGLFNLIKSDKLIDEKVLGTYRTQVAPTLITLSSPEAFGIATKNNWYMTQAFMKQAGLEVPEKPPKAKLNYDSSTLPIGPIDYLISPFARSLPLDQKWQREKWQELINKMPDKKFGVLGNYKYDDPMYINGKNVHLFYSMSFDVLCRLFKNSQCLISVVTGTSHLAFHLGVKNVLLNNQNFAWGTNPEAICIRDYIPNIIVEQVMEKL